MSASDPPPLITECPNCNTRFRVGESQLQMAHGRVRCGACLAVFAGVDHLLLDESSPPPELPEQSDALDSVLAELKIDSGSDSEAGADAGSDVEWGGQSRQTSESHDWTSVSVDTQEFGRDPSGDRYPETQTEDDLEVAASAGDLSGKASDAPFESSSSRPAKARASIEDALNDEEALRWWLEDELPGESGSADEHFAEGLGDEMVVQLSHLDAVQEEELDLRSLIATAENDTSARELEELFEEDALETEPEGAAALAALEVDQAQSQPNNQSTQSQPEVLGEVSANELQSAIDEAEPLVSRAMANGTIAAAAERMSAATARQKVVAPEQEQQAQETAAETVALITSPHRSARTPSNAGEAGAALSGGPPHAKSAKPSAEAAAKPIAQAPAKIENPIQATADLTADLTNEPVADLIANPNDDPWDSTNFAETPAESVADIAEEMAAAGKPVVDAGPSIFERLKTSVNDFLGHALTLRIATILAFVLLSAQVLYWQFDDWSKTPTMRPVYASICSVLGCELPVRRSVRDLQSRKLAVRSHPEKSDALLVDALIINEASFEQPFPVIELQFMDISQQLVGSYLLEPSMYLDGELAGSDALMAIRTPVHVDIDIPDPGPKAVNYQLQFR